MKKLLFILPVFCYTAINSQNVFKVTPGTTISDDQGWGGQRVITLENIDLDYENDTLTHDNTMINVRFSGNTNSTISSRIGPFGNGNGIVYPRIEIAKTGGAKLMLQSQNIHVHDQVIFTSGYLDLNSNVLCLFNSGGLVGECDNSRIIGPSGGYVQYYQRYQYTTPGWSTGISYGYSDPVSVSRIRRGHYGFTGNLGTGFGIQRYFQIVDVESDTDAAITVRMKYLESELNGLNENDLVFWSSPDSLNWTNRGYTTRNITDNYLELSNLTNFENKYFTLAPAGVPRPITSSPQHIKAIAMPGKETIANKWKTWPNPADKVFWIDITSTSASLATTSIFDSKGAFIRTQTNHLTKGNNRLVLDLKNLATGIYYITTSWDAGKEKRSTSFLKL